MSKEITLIPIQEDKFAAVFVKGGLQPFIDWIKKDAEGFVADVSTPAGRKEASAKTGFIKRKKAQIEKAGKAYIQSLMDPIQPAKDELKRAMDELSKWRDEVGKPMTEWREEEKRKKEADQLRIDQINQKIERISDYHVCAEDGTPLHLSECSSEMIQSAIGKLSDYQLTEKDFQELLQKAEQTKLQKLDELEAALKTAQEKEKLEADQKELEREKQLVKKQKEALDEQIENKMKSIRDCRYLGATWKNAQYVIKLRDRLASIIVDSSFGDRFEEASALKVEILSELRKGVKLALEADSQASPAPASPAPASPAPASPAPASPAPASQEQKKKINRKILELFIEAGFSQEAAYNTLKIIIRKGRDLIFINYGEKKIISSNEYETLIKEQAFLEALHQAGVDNWIGYEIAQNFLE